MINSAKSLIMIVAPPSVQERIHIKGTFVGDQITVFVLFQRLKILDSSLIRSCVLTLKWKKLSRAAMLHWGSFRASKDFSLEMSCFSLLLLLSSLKWITATLSTTLSFTILIERFWLSILVHYNLLLNFEIYSVKINFISSFYIKCFSNSSLFK